MRTCFPRPRRSGMRPVGRTRARATCRWPPPSIPATGISTSIVDRCRSWVVDLRSELGEYFVERSFLAPRVQSRSRVAQHAVGYLETERAVAFELRLAEELIDRSLVRKRGVLDGIGPDTRILDAMIAGLDVEDHAGLAVAAVGGRIIDHADRRIGMLCADIVVAGGRALLELRQTVELDRDAEVDRDLAHCIAEIREGIIRVGPGIDRDDVPTAAAYHLVDAEVLEMTAVRQVDVRSVIGGETERFLDQRLDRECRTLMAVGLPALPAGIAQPPTEPHVEQRQQEGDSG